MLGHPQMRAGGKRHLHDSQGDRQDWKCCTRAWRLHPSPSRQAGARQFGGQGGDSSEKTKASHFTGIYSVCKGPGSSTFACILATKAQLSLWVGFKSTKKWMKSHDKSAGAGARCWWGPSPLLSRERRGQPCVGACRRSPADAVCPSAPLRSPLIPGWSHDIYQLLPRGLKTMAPEVGEYCH